MHALIIEFWQKETNLMITPRNYVCNITNLGACFISKNNIWNLFWKITVFNSNVISIFYILTLESPRTLRTDLVHLRRLKKPIRKMCHIGWTCIHSNAIYIVSCRYKFTTKRLTLRRLINHQRCETFIMYGTETTQ